MPGEHEVQLVAPEDEACPGAQSEHPLARLVAPETAPTFPGGQALQVLSSDAPSADEYRPAAQFRHVATEAAPLELLLHFPLGQLMHTAIFDTGWYSPASHGEQLDAPAWATRPGAQATHVKSSSRFVVDATW